MEIKNCRRCRKIYQYNGQNICNQCIHQEEEDFQKVKKYVVDHSGSTPVEVSEETGVDLKAITRFLREGRLESDNFEMEEGDLECENCRRAIKAGRFCDRCSQILQQEFAKAAQSLNTDKPAKPASTEPNHAYNAILNRKQH